MGAPTLKSAADATTIVAAEISLGVGIANGPIDYNFTQGQQVKLNAIPTTATATFSLDVTLDLNKYGLLIYRLDALKNTTQKSIKLTASYTADEIISVSSFKNTLDSEGFLSEIIDEAEGKVKIKIPVAMGEFADLSNGESVIYRLIVTNKETKIYMKKINSEVKFCDNNFKIKIGTTDKKNHNSIYIELGTYIMPNEVKNTYNSEIEDFEKIIKRFVKDNITQNNDFIIIIDIANDRISVNKKSYLEIQIFLKLKDGEVVKMSKRTGNSITISELIEEIGVDAARYFFATRSFSQLMDAK